MGRLRTSDRRKAPDPTLCPLGRDGRRSGKPFAGWLPCTFGLVLLAGCSGFEQSAGIDPLLGGPPLRSATVAAPAPLAPAPLQVPPLPTANSTLSTAALAAGAPRPANGGQDLRIGSPSGSTGNDGWARQGLGAGSQDGENSRMAASGGATLRPPQPIAEPPSNREMLAVANPSPAGGNAKGITTFEQAEAALKARGTLWQQLVMVGENGDWKYSCSIPNRQNPRIRRTYEARASDPVAALQAVLEQLDKEQ